MSASGRAPTRARSSMSKRLPGVGAGDHLQRRAPQRERGRADDADGRRHVVEVAHARAVYARSARKWIEQLAVDEIGRRRWFGGVRVALLSAGLVTIAGGGATAGGGTTTACGTTAGCAIGAGRAAAARISLDRARPRGKRAQPGGSADGRGDDEARAAGAAGYARRIDHGRRADQLRVRPPRPSWCVAPARPRPAAARSRASASPAASGRSRARTARARARAPSLRRRSSARPGASAVARAQMASSAGVHRRVHVDGGAIGRVRASADAASSNAAPRTAAARSASPTEARPRRRRRSPARPARAQLLRRHVAEVALQGRGAVASTPPRAPCRCRSRRA